MRSWDVRFGVLVFVVAGCGHANDMSACPTIGCGPIAIVDTDLPLSFDQIRVATATVCHNDDCVMGSFDSLNLPPEADTGLGVTFGSIQAFVRANRNGGFWLEVFWPSGRDATGTGDTYKVTVFDATGQMVVASSDTVTGYDTVTPNGASCPPSCQEIHFDHHTP